MRDEIFIKSPKSGLISLILWQTSTITEKWFYISLNFFLSKAFFSVFYLKNISFPCYFLLSFFQLLSFCCHHRCYQLLLVFPLFRSKNQLTSSLWLLKLFCCFFFFFFIYVQLSEPAIFLVNAKDFLIFFLTLLGSQKMTFACEN